MEEVVEEQMNWMMKMEQIVVVDSLSFLRLHHQVHEAEEAGRGGAVIGRNRLLTVVSIAHLAMFLMLMGVFSFLFASDPNYKLNLIVGLFLWDFFAEGTKASLISVRDTRFPSVTRGLRG